jgi:hypothetical protein
MHVIFISPPLFTKVVDVLPSLSNNKAPGVDGVTAELLKFGGHDALQWLHLLIIVVCESGVAPSQWKHARMMPLHKGGQHIMANYHGINLLDVYGKVYTAMPR